MLVLPSGALPHWPVLAHDDRQLVVQAVAEPAEPLRGLAPLHLPGVPERFQPLGDLGVLGVLVAPAVAVWVSRHPVHQPVASPVLPGVVDPRPWPEGMRIIVRRERPHPGAQLDAFEHRDGFRYQPMTTNTRIGQLAFLEARHRAHARVEDRIRQAQNAGLHRLPSRVFSINEAWLMLALTAADLLAWTQTILLTSADDQTKALARAEWKTIRYRLLHTGARITRTARRTHLHLSEGWPWAHTLARAFTVLRRIPLPA